MIKKIFKYIHIYKILFKYAFINATAYRVSFLVAVLIELGYSIAIVIFFQVIFANVTSIADWSYYEVLFLQGINIVTSEITLGAFWLFNLQDLPRKIKDGEIDIALLKPFNSLFNLSFSKPYFTAFIAILPGIFLAIYSFIQMGLEFNLLRLSIGTMLLFLGFIIAYSISVIFSSLGFIFDNATSLSEVGIRTLLAYKKYPHTMYGTKSGRLLTYVFPVVFVSSVPTSAIIRAVEPKYIFLAVLLSILLLYIALNVWRSMIKRYSSASS